MDADHENENGFTLFEIIFVLTLMAVLAVTFIGNMKDSNAELISGIEALKSHLRYAQSKAMSTSKVMNPSTNWYVLFSSETPPESYSLYESGEGIKSIPGESGTTVSLADGITISDGTFSAGLVVNFDYLGRPFTDAGGATAQNGVRIIATSSAGHIEIKPETGYIP